MNEYYYNNFIRPYLKINNIHILNKKQLHILGLKKREKNKKIYTQIVIHLGSPCFRYCVCKFLLKEDWDDLYKNHFLLSNS